MNFSLRSSPPLKHCLFLGAVATESAPEADLPEGKLPHGIEVQVLDLEEHRCDNRAGRS